MSEDNEGWARVKRVVGSEPLTYAEGLLKKIIIEMPLHECNDMSHTKKDYHGYGEDCPPLRRLDNAVKQAQAYLKARQAPNGTKLSGPTASQIQEEKKP